MTNRHGCYERLRIQGQFQIRACIFSCDQDNHMRAVVCTSPRHVRFFRVCFSLHQATQLESSITWPDSRSLWR